MNKPAQFPGYSLLFERPFKLLVMGFKTEHEACRNAAEVAISRGGNVEARVFDPLGKELFVERYNGADKLE